MLIYIIKLRSLIIKHPSYKSICTVSQQFMEMLFFVFVLNITYQQSFKEHQQYTGNQTRVSGQDEMM